jgi:O-antigen ligase
MSLGLFWGLKDSIVVERLISAVEQTKNAKSEEEMFDGRAVQYVVGFDVFKENFLFGIGLRNFSQIDRNGLVLHSEYLVQLVECGIIGTFLFLFFHIFIIRRLLILRKVNIFKKSAELFLLFYLVMSILSLGTWFYNMEIIWIMIGLAIRCILPFNTRETKHLKPNIEVLQ